MLGSLAALIIEKLYQELEKERDVQAESLFKNRVAEGDIQFRLRLDGHNWRMPRHIDSNSLINNIQLTNDRGGPLERSLFTPQYQSDFNQEERDVAVYLDGEMVLTWWHRNVARSEYGIQGWKKGKVYPDFIFAVKAEGHDQRIAAVETKGDHLDNLDTDYKRELLRFLSSSYPWENSTPVGELELVADSGQTMHCELVLMSEWETRLPQIVDEVSNDFSSQTK